MARLTSNITIIQGSSFYLKIKATNPDGSNLTGFTSWAPRSQIRQSFDASLALAQFSFTSYPLLTPPEWIAELTPTQTSALPYSSTLVYDVEIQNSAGQVVNIQSGTVTVLPEVTR